MLTKIAFKYVRSIAKRFHLLKLSLKACDLSINQSVIIRLIFNRHYLEVYSQLISKSGHMTFRINTKVLHLIAD